MKKSKIVSLVMVSSLVLASCQPQKGKQLYVRGNDEDDYSSASVNNTHGFHPYYYVSKDYTTYNDSTRTFAARRGGYMSNAIFAHAIHTSNYRNPSGYSAARISRGGFGSTASHSTGS